MLKRLSVAVLLCLLSIPSLGIAGHVRPIPIGIQNSNPGNVIAHDWRKWHGSVGEDAYGHVIFKSDLHGFRAIKKVLHAYDRRKLDTSYKIVSRYINKKATEKQRLDYCKTIGQFTGRGPHEAVDLKDKKALLQIAKGIVRHENGMDPYSENLYKRVFLFEE